MKILNINFKKGWRELFKLKKNTLVKRFELSLYGFRCLMLSFLGKFYYQFSCNVQKSRARGTTGEGGRGKNQAGMKLSRSMASVMSFNTLLIHCYYFMHTWRILRPYTKSASARVAGWFGMASRVGRTLVHICSTGVRLLFECCSSAVRVRVEAQSKASRRAPEGLSNKCRSRVEAQSKDCRRALEGLPNNSRSRVEELANRLLRFTCNDGKMMNDLYMNRLILRWFESFCRGVRGKVESMLVKSKRSSQNGLNEAGGFLFDKERADDIKRPMVYGLQLIAIFCVLFSFASIVEVKAQELRQGGATGIGEIKPLAVGQKVPEEFWTEKHLFYVDGDTVRKNLEEYRGKSILLDFWNSWCKSCISEIPKIVKAECVRLGQLNLLMVTDDSISKVRPLMKNNIHLKDLSMTTLIKDNLVSSYFPHRYVPYYVLINQQGMVQSILSSSAFNLELVDKLIKTNDYYESDIVEEITLYPTLLASKYAKEKDVLYSFFFKGNSDLFGGVNVRRKDSLGRIYSMTLHNVSYYTYVLSIAKLYAQKFRIELHRDFLNSFDTIEKGICTYEVSVPKDSINMFADFASLQLSVNLPYQLTVEPINQKILSIRSKNNSQPFLEGKFSRLAKYIKDVNKYDGYVLDYTTDSHETDWSSVVLKDSLDVILQKRDYYISEEYISIPYISLEKRAI